MTLVIMSARDVDERSKYHVRRIQSTRKETKSIAFSTARRRLGYSRVQDSFRSGSRGSSGYPSELDC